MDIRPVFNQYKAVTYIDHEKFGHNKFWDKRDAQIFFSQMSDGAQILS